MWRLFYEVFERSLRVGERTSILTFRPTWPLCSRAAPNLPRVHRFCFQLLWTGIALPARSFKPSSNLDADPKRKPDEIPSIFVPRINAGDPKTDMYLNVLSPDAAFPEQHIVRALPAVSTESPFLNQYGTYDMRMPRGLRHVKEVEGSIEGYTSQRCPG
jgi:hypothetical protein